MHKEIKMHLYKNKHQTKLFDSSKAKNVDTSKAAHSPKPQLVGIFKQYYLLLHRSVPLGITRES